MGRIQVTVVTGFLGAGKSTLLERWLADLPRESTAVIVNEQGEVGIDGALLANRAARLLEITGGCICCTTQAALHDALVDFAESETPPERILIETSGAASPSGVLRALTRGDARAQLRLDGVITVIDAQRAEKSLRFDLTVEQLGFADVVVMSRADTCTDADLDALERRLAPLAPGAVFARAERGTVREATDLMGLLDLRSNALRVLPLDPAGPQAGHGIDSVCLVVEGELDESRFGLWMEEALGAIEARLLRVKGILAIQGVAQRVIVQGVSESIEVSLAEPWADGPRTSTLVVLGLALDEMTLRSGFEACAAAAPPTP